MRLQVVIDSKLVHFIPNERLLGELIFHSDDYRINLKRFDVYIYSMQDAFASRECTFEYFEEQIVAAANVEKKLRDEIHDLRKLNSTTSRLIDLSKRVGGVNKLEEIVSYWESQKKDISENDQTKSSEKSILINQLFDNLTGKKK